MIRFGAVILLSLVFVPLLGQHDCGNQVRLTTGDTGDVFPRFYRTMNKSFSEKFVESYPADSFFYGHYRTRNDIAYHLTRIGRYKGAVAILREIHRQHPADYDVILNLTTAYERYNMPDSALIIADELVSKYPDAFFGSLWIDHKVLQAKLLLKNDPDWLRTHKILNLGKITGDTTKLTQARFVINDMVSHFVKRIQNTIAPNPLVAGIMSEYGDALKNYSLERAYMIYYIGQQYDSAGAYGIQSKLDSVTVAIRQCNLDVPDQEKITYFFPAISDTKLIMEEEGVFMSPEKQMRRVLNYQESESARTRKPFLIGVVIVGLTILCLGILLIWRRL